MRSRSWIDGCLAAFSFGTAREGLKNLISSPNIHVFMNKNLFVCSCPWKVQFASKQSSVKVLFAQYNHPDSFVMSKSEFHKTYAFFF